eukprot:gnl/MRDRNA2_/MRDRNA2_35619_c0_seq1.p1 gnl/MRDRNA2_/MRDRNA2_35619_c0~~gnl/MRDRNA2_/MRDRNA2_35619_c0_seq1.p1  ORF type:complete len:662 (+),score=159.68 gnl/MRDRNA2_/MRDRNA2_35619_c0_seq1:18-2003(+)
MVNPEQRGSVEVSTMQAHFEVESGASLVSGRQLGVSKSRFRSVSSAALIATACALLFYGYRGKIFSSMGVAGTAGSTDALPVSAAGGGSGSDSLIIQITKDTSQTEKMRIQRTKAFKDIWPTKCSGVRADGEALALNTDGFRCHETTETVVEIVDVKWLQNPAKEACCQKQCMSIINYNKVCTAEIHELPSAVLAASAAVQTMEAGGQEFQVEVADAEELRELNEEEEEEDFGFPDEQDENPLGEESPRKGPEKPKVLELMMAKFDLKFKSNSAQLTEKSDKFFIDSKEQLSVLMTTALTATENPNAKFLVCPHASTTAEEGQAGDIPEKRAEVIRQRFIEANILPEDGSMGSVGPGIGHHKYEAGTNFAGGRFGTVVIKVYDSTRPAPSCKMKDIHTKKHNFNFRELVGSWTPVPSYNPDGQQNAIPPYWEDKMIMVVKKGTHAELQMFKGSEAQGWRAKSDYLDPKCEKHEPDEHGYFIKCAFDIEYKHNGWFSPTSILNVKIGLRESRTVKGTFTMWLREKKGNQVTWDGIMMKNNVGKQGKDPGRAGKFELFVGKDGQFYFRLKASNGRIILASEGYTAKASALNGIRSVKENSADADKFEKKTSAKDQPYFVLKAGNGEPIGHSEMYSSAQACDNGIKSVMTFAPSADIIDLTGSS